MLIIVIRAILLIIIIRNMRVVGMSGVVLWSLGLCFVLLVINTVKVRFRDIKQLRSVECIY